VDNLKAPAFEWLLTHIILKIDVNNTDFQVDNFVYKNNLKGVDMNAFTSYISLYQIRSSLRVCREYSKEIKH